MWIFYAFLSAFFAGITSILAKIGIQKVDSNVATAIRTIIVVIFSVIMVIISKSYTPIRNIDSKSLIYLCLSGFSTGASWLCYFKALQKGDINKVVPIDKSSTILTLILAFIVLGEEVTYIKITAIIFIAVGTFMMIQRENMKTQKEEKKDWIIYAILSAVFAALTSILGKIGISNIESNLGTAIRTIVVLIMAWIIVILTGKIKCVMKINKKELMFICLSGIATGASWICYYSALQDGFASVVVSVDKLSIIITILFSYFIMHEKLTKRSLLGLVFIVIGTLSMVLL